MSQTSYTTEQASRHTPIYLDYQSTTPCDERVVDAMIPFFCKKFGNPSSALHPSGRQAEEAVSNARRKVADLVSSHPAEILFAASATESINLAIQGSARAAEPRRVLRKRRRIVSTAIEHKAVLETVRALEHAGWAITFLPVERSGHLALDMLEDALDEDVLLVSVQAANQEIATLQAIGQAAALAHHCGAIIHCDASQIVGKLPVDVEDWNVDLLSFSGHKMYGPKGIGVLYIRNGVQGSSLEPVIYGGGQEYGIRSGTLNVPAIVGLGEACKLASELLEEEAERLRSYRDQLERELLDCLVDFWVNGDLSNRLPGATSLTFPGVDAEALILNVPELALSTGSACTSGALEPSYVLTAIGLSRDEAYSTIRVSFGRDSNESMPRRIAELLIAAVNRIRKVGTKSERRILSR